MEPGEGRGVPPSLRPVDDEEPDNDEIYLVIRYMFFESRPPVPDAICLILGERTAERTVKGFAEDADEDEMYHAVQIVHPKAFPPGALYG